MNKAEIYYDAFNSDVESYSKEYIDTIENALLYVKGIDGVYYKHTREMSGYTIYDNTSNNTECLPLPPDSLRQLYGILDDGAYDDHQYLESGRLDYNSLLKIISQDNFELSSGTRILEFGCSSGRIIRWFKDHTATCELWGCDVDAESISWAQQNLKPFFNFFLSTTAYHLPFTDGYFDLIYAGSVFTHIGDLADAWLLELRRLLSPHGRLYITIFDEASIESINRRWPNHPYKHFLDEQNAKHGNVLANENVFKFVFGASPKYEHVVYFRKPFIEHLEKMFRICSITNEAYGYQSAYLLTHR